MILFTSLTKNDCQQLCYNNGYLSSVHWIYFLLFNNFSMTLFYFLSLLRLKPFFFIVHD